LTGGNIADEQLRHFTFHLPVQLSSLQIQEMAAQAGIGPVGDIIGHEPSKEALALTRARRILRIFERRAKTSFGELLGEPGWTMLLDLYVREADGKKTNVSSAIIGSMAPPTTGLRWVHLLTEKGFIVRTDHQNDSRVVYVNLTDQTRAEITELLATIS
jgi:DNA-binding MarR family transcriptional regulator